MADKNDYGDAVDEIMGRFGIAGKGINHGILANQSGIGVGLDTHPTDEEMKFVRDRLIERFRIKVEARKYSSNEEGEHAFVFYPKIKAEHKVETIGG